MEIRFEGGVLDGLSISLGVIVFSEQDVVPDSVVHDPGDLTSVGNSSVCPDLWVSFLSHLTKDAVGQRGLSASVSSNQGDELASRYI